MTAGDGYNPKVATGFFELWGGVGALQDLEGGVGALVVERNRHLLICFFRYRKIRFADMREFIRLVEPASKYVALSTDGDLHRNAIYSGGHVYRTEHRLYLGSGNGEIDAYSRIGN